MLAFCTCKWRYLKFDDCTFCHVILLISSLNIVIYINFSHVFSWHQDRYFLKCTTSKVSYCLSEPCMKFTLPAVHSLVWVWHRVALGPDFCSRVSISLLWKADHFSSIAHILIGSICKYINCDHFYSKIIAFMPNFITHAI